MSSYLYIKENLILNICCNMFCTINVNRIFFYDDYDLYLKPLYKLYINM